LSGPAADIHDIPASQDLEQNIPSYLSIRAAKQGDQVQDSHVNGRTSPGSNAPLKVYAAIIPPQPEDSFNVADCARHEKDLRDQWDTLQPYRSYQERTIRGATFHRVLGGGGGWGNSAGLITISPMDLFGSPTSSAGPDNLDSDNLLPGFLSHPVAPPGHWIQFFVATDPSQQDEYRGRLSESDLTSCASITLGCIPESVLDTSSSATQFPRFSKGHLMLLSTKAIGYDVFTRNEHDQTQSGFSASSDIPFSKLQVLFPIKEQTPSSTVQNSSLSPEPSRHPISGTSKPVTGIVHQNSSWRTTSGVSGTSLTGITRTFSTMPETSANEDFGNIRAIDLESTKLMAPSSGSTDGLKKLDNNAGITSTSSHPTPNLSRKHSLRLRKQSRMKTRDGATGTLPIRKTRFFASIINKHYITSKKDQDNSGSSSVSSLKIESPTNKSSNQSIYIRRVKISAKDLDQANFSVSYQSPTREVRSKEKSSHELPKSHQPTNSRNSPSLNVRYHRGAIQIPSVRRHFARTLPESTSSMKNITETGPSLDQAPHISNATSPALGPYGRRSRTKKEINSPSSTGSGSVDTLKNEFRRLRLHPLSTTEVEAQKNILNNSDSLMFGREIAARIYRRKKALKLAAEPASPKRQVKARMVIPRLRKLTLRSRSPKKPKIQRVTAEKSSSANTRDLPVNRPNVRRYKSKLRIKGFYSSLGPERKTRWGRFAGALLPGAARRVRSLQNGTTSTWRSLRNGWDLVKYPHPNLVRPSAVRSPAFALDDRAMELINVEWEELERRVDTQVAAIMSSQSTASSSTHDDDNDPSVHGDGLEVLESLAKESQSQKRKRTTLAQRRASRQTAVLDEEALRNQIFQTEYREWRKTYGKMPTEGQEEQGASNTGPQAVQLISDIKALLKGM
jgi:hypothetical protein